MRAGRVAHYQRHRGISVENDRHGYPPQGRAGVDDDQNDRVQMEFQIPSRGIIGLRSNVLTASGGEAIMAHRFLDFQPWKGDIERRTNGSLIAIESGTAYAYAIDKLQDRGRFFIFPQEEVYAGQVVGENAKDNDIPVNVTKSKKLTNMRASGADDKARIVPPVVSASKKPSNTSRKTNMWK